MLLPGLALNFGPPRSNIRVRIGQIEVTATAATEINTKEVTVSYLAESNSYLVWGNSAPKSTGITQRSVSRKRPVQVTQGKKYRVKIVAVVDNETEEKWEVWLYGDRTRPKKIYEVDKKVDEFNEFGSVLLEDIVLDNTGKKKTDWEVFVKVFDSSEQITLPPSIVEILPNNYDTSTSSDKSYTELIRQGNTVSYKGNYARNLEYKGGYAVIRNDLLIDTASEPRDYFDYRLYIAEEETVLYQWDFSGLEQQENIPLILYLDRGLNEQMGETYIPLDDIGTTEFIFPENYQFPPFDSIEELDNFSSFGDFANAVASKDINNFRIDPYNGGGNGLFFGVIVAGGFDFSGFSEGVKRYISDIYPRASHIVSTEEEEYIYTNPTLPYFVHINKYNFSLSASGRLGFNSVDYGFSLSLVTNNPDTIEQIGLPYFSYHQGLIMNYLPFENNSYSLSYSSSNPFQSGNPSVSRFESLAYLNGIGTHLFKDNLLTFSLKKISSFLSATFQNYQFIDTSIPSLHLHGQNSFIVSEYSIKKNDSLQEIQRFYRYYFYLSEGENWLLTEIEDYSILEKDGKLNTPKEFFTLKGRELYEIVDDEKLTQSLTRKTKVNVTTYSINSQGIIEKKGTKKIEALPLKKQASIKSACFF